VDLNRFLMPRDRAVLFLKALVTGLVAGAAAEALGLPLPWMLGPLLAAAAVSLAGVKLGMPEPLRFGARGVVGVLLGSALDGEVLARVSQWPVSVSILIVGIIGVIALVTLYYRYVAGYDRITALASALPGGISSIAVISIQLGAEPTRTVTSQLLRISLVVLLVPPLYQVWQGETAGTPAMSGEPIDLLGRSLWVVLLIPLAYRAADRLRFPVPEMMGPMVVAAALTLAGLEIMLPAWLFGATFLVLGTSIGARFYGIGSRRLLLVNGAHGLVATALIFAGCFGLALLIHWATGVPLPVALLSLIPGGIAEMAILAAALGVDPVFVTFHQLLRSVLLNALAPVVLRRIGRRQPAAGE
jgi:uncharacterized protein